MVRIGQSGLIGAAEPAVRLVDEAVLVVVDAHRAERAFGEVEELVPLRGSLAGDQVDLIVAVEMDLVSPIAECLALLQLLDNVGVAGGGDERREPVQAGNDPVLDLAGGNLARPSHDARHAETAFQHRTLTPANGVWPPSGQVKFSAPLSVVNTRIVSSSRPLSFSFFITAPTMSSSWAMPAS